MKIEVSHIDHRTLILLTQRLDEGGGGMVRALYVLVVAADRYSMAESDEQIRGG